MDLRLAARALHFFFSAAVFLAVFCLTWYTLPGTTIRRKRWSLSLASSSAAALSMHGFLDWTVGIS